MKTLFLATAFVLATAFGPAAHAQPPSQEVPSSFDAERAWAELEYALREKYAYIERDDIDVEAQLARSKALAVVTPDAAGFRKIAHQTALTFMDPHLIIGPFTPEDYSIVMSEADLDVRFGAGRLIVADARAGWPAFDAGIRSGDEITRLGGLEPVAAAKRPFGAVLPNPTAAQLDYGATLAVNGMRGIARTLTVRSSDGERELELPSATQFARKLPDRPQVDHRRIGPGDSVGVIRINNALGDNATIPAFDRAMEALQGVKVMVLDMRDTPSGGNTEVGRSIIGHFTDAVRPYQVHRIPAFEREFTVPREFVERVYPRAPYFDGPVYVLHGRWTGSMGEGIVIGMDAAAPKAITVGSNMGDLLGGLWNYNLEVSGARIDLGGEALLHVDGTPREDYVADIVVTPADTDAMGQDPAIAAVLRQVEE